MKEWLFKNFKQWYKSGVATDEDLEICLAKGALTADQVEEIKAFKEQQE